MNRGTTARVLLACGLLLTGGCGAVPELLIEAAKVSAKEAIEKRIDEVIGGTFDDLLSESLDFDNLDLPFGEDEEDASAQAEDEQGP